MNTNFGFIGLSHRRSTLIIISIIIFIGSFFALQSWNNVSANRANTKVTLSGTKIERSSPAAADFDGDGDKEIVVGGTDGRLYVVAYNGSSWAEAWSIQTADSLNAAGAPSGCQETSISDIYTAPSIADLDDDGRMEIVVTLGGFQGDNGGTHRNGGVMVYTQSAVNSLSFVPVSGWPQPKADIMGAGPGASDPDGCWDGFTSSAALGDLDNDGDLELMVQGLDRAIHAWEHDGTYVTGWPLNKDNLGISRGGWSTPALGDLDNDGFLEVVIGTDAFVGSAPPYLLFAVNGDGSVLPGFPVETDQNTQSSPAIADINGDGNLDIIAGTGTYESSGGNKVQAWDNQGNALPGWPQSTDDNMFASPAIGDIDGDGDLEVVIGCGNQTGCNKMYAFHGDGSAVSGFPTNIPLNAKWGPNDADAIFSPLIADYDGDGTTEIFASLWSSFGPTTIEPNGQTSTDTTLRAEDSSLGNSPLIDDVDNDGNLELILAGESGFNTGTAGVYIIDLAGQTTDALPWPMFHKNLYRTGAEIPVQKPAMDCLNDITLLQQGGTDLAATVNGQLTLVNTAQSTIKYTITHGIAALTSPASNTTGTFADSETLTLSIATGGLANGFNNLGSLTIATEDPDGDPVTGCSETPQTINLTLYIGDLTNVYLPLAIQ